MNPGSVFLAAGALSAAIAVGAGAFGAHGLRSSLSPDMLTVFETAVRYQMYHALGLLTAGILERMAPSSLLRGAGWSFVGGTLLFSGSLYVLATAQMRWLGAVTPFGGVAFISGWVLLAWWGITRGSVKIGK